MTSPQHDATAGPNALATPRRWALLAVMAVGAAMPWYALREFPLVSLGAATINILDALVGCAVLLALPAIGAALRKKDPAVLAVLAFLGYMVIPLVLGPLRDPGARFYAVREARGLAFYTLALAFVAGGYTPRDYQRFAAAYVAGAMAAIVAVFIHLLWHVPLPGYPAMIASTPAAQAGIIARYLEWTVPVVAFLFCLAGVLRRAPLARRAWWAAGLCATVWYLITMHERTPEAVALSVAILLMLLPSLGGFTWSRAVITAAGLVAIVGIGLGVIPAPPWLRSPAHGFLRGWLQATNGDPSVQIRMRELRSALPIFLSHPVFGGGLGSIVAARPPDFPGGPWRYIAPGYGYLLVKTGIVGFALYLAMVAVAIRRGTETLRAGVETENWPQWSIAMVGMIALLALNLTHTVADIPEGAIAFSLFFGMLVVRAP